MKNAMQLKAIIKNLAKEKHISAQLVMQNFILNGGFLIAAMEATRIPDQEITTMSTYWLNCNMET